MIETSGQTTVTTARLRTRLDEPLFVGTLAAIAGILLADLGVYSTISAVGAIVLGLGFFLQSKQRSFFLLAVAGAFALVHDQRHRAAESLPNLEQIQAGTSLLVEVEGVIDSIPKPISSSQGRVTFFLTLTEIRQIGALPEPASQRLFVTATADPPPDYGDRIRLKGRLSSPAGTRNPGEFDFGKYLKRKGVLARLSCRAKPGIQLIATDQGNPIIAASNHARHWVGDTITYDLARRDPDIAAVLTAMTLGSREDARDEVIESFRTSGTLHIFAVSGLHVGLIALLLWHFSAPLPLGRRTRALAIILILFSYAFITGLRPSAVRASIMAAAVLAGPLLDRESRLINSLGAAGFLILAIDSNQLFLPGFQLSFMVLLALTLLHKPILSLFLPLVSPDPFIPRSLLTDRQRSFFNATRTVAETFAVSIAAWLGSLPLMILHFHLVTPIAPIANLLLIPAAFCVLGTAILSTFTGLTRLTTICALFNNANFAFASILTATAMFFANLPPPISHFYLTSRTIIRPPCEITVIDLPRGGASTLIATRSRKEWLIDTGNTRDYKPTIAPVLHEHAGITRLDALLLTHTDAAHIGAATSVIENFHPRKIFTPLPNRSSSTYRTLEKKLTAQTLPHTGQLLKIDAHTTIEVLYAPDPKNPPRSSDDACLVLLLHTHGWRILLTGDAGFTTEQQLLLTEPQRLRADLIIRGHHGTDHSLTPALLRAVNPAAIIANARDFENPSPASDIWQKAITDRQIELFDQSTTGAISIRIHPTKLEIRSHLTDQTLTLNRAQ